MTPEQQEFLHCYLKTLNFKEQGTFSSSKVVAEHFCDDEDNANECAKLIDHEVKQASCGLKAVYDIENQPIPKVNDLIVVLNWEQSPVCVVKLTDVKICQFNEVPPEFATLEGEGDGTYEWWRTSHINFFKNEAKNMGIAFDENSELVLEYFVKVFPKPYQI